MNILKTLRKPSLSILLTSLILFTSCYAPQDTDLEEFTLVTLDEYTETHISLTNELFDIYNEQDNIDTKTISKVPEYFNNSKELQKFLEKVNFSNSFQITELLVKIQKNTSNYLKSSGSANLDQEEIINKLTSSINNHFNTDPINNHFNTKPKSLHHKSPCGDAFMEGRRRCERNLSIALAAVGASAFFTLGIGTAIGGAAAVTIFGLCMNDNSNDFADCLKNQ